MEVRWSSLAAKDLERIFKRIQQDNPTAAREVVRNIYDGCAALKDFPNRGRAGRIQGRRELPFPGLPYLLSIESKNMPLKFLASGTAHRTGDKQ